MLETKKTLGLLHTSSLKHCIQANGDLLKTLADRREESSAKKAPRRGPSRRWPFWTGSAQLRSSRAWGRFFDTRKMLKDVMQKQLPVAQ